MDPRTNNFPYPTPPGLPIPTENTNDSEPGVESGDESGILAYPNGLDEAAIVNFCKTRNSVFTTWFDPYIKRLGNLRLIFRNAPTAAKAGKVVQMPVGSGIADSINARLQPAVLNRPKFAEAVPEFETVDNSQPQLVEDFVNQTVIQTTRGVSRGKQAIKSAIVDTMLIWRNVWRTKTEKISVPQYVPDPTWTPNPMDPMAQPPMIYQGEQEGEITRGFWDWELEDPANMAWDPHTVTCLADSPWARKRAPMSYNEMLRRQTEGVFKGVERLRFVVPAGVQGNMREGWVDELKRASGDNHWNFTYADEKMYQVEEWWADMTWGQDGQTIQAKMRWFIVEGAYVVAIEENPLIPQRIPWNSCPLIQDPHNLTGLSPLDTVRNIQEQINTFAGYQDSLAERMAKPTIFYDESSGLSGRTSFMRTYGLQPVQNVQGIKEMVMDATPMQAIQAYINFLIELMKDATGATEQFQGTEGAETATEFQGMVAAAGSRFADMVDTLSQGWLQELARECFLHYQQFGTDGQMFVRAAQTEGTVRAITRKDLQGRYTWIAASSATERAKTQELDMALKAIDGGQKLGVGPDGTVFNGHKAYKDSIIPLLGQKTGSDWFIQAPPPPMVPGPMGPGVESPAPDGAPLPPMPE